MYSVVTRRRVYLMQRVAVYKQELLMAKMHKNLHALLSEQCIGQCRAANKYFFETVYQMALLNNLITIIIGFFNSVVRL